MKTLFIAPFKDTSGYASAARNYARALIKIGEDKNLVLRSVRYDTGNKTPLAPELLALHNKPATDISVVIQMLTPNEMRPHPNKKNIAICCWETDRIPKHWVDQLNKFNLVIVPCEANKKAFQDSGVTTDIRLLNFTFFQEDYVLDGEKFIIPNTNDETIKYYNICQWSHKKGIDSLLRGYFRAFQNDENVCLVLKGYIGMKTQQGDALKMKESVQAIKSAMRLPKYPKIYLTDQMMTDEEVLKFHRTCDIYVNTSRGEGWGVPVFESLLMGKELISVNHTGMVSYLTDEQSKYYHVDSYKDYVINMPHPDPSLYTGLDMWQEPSVPSITEAFLRSYNTLEKLNTSTSVWYLKVHPENIAMELTRLINE